MLTKLTHQATQLIIQSIDSAETMGANILITRGEEELLYAQAGFADREKQKPIERNTIFRLYSMTKPITATAAMILLERGQLDLYQPLSDVIPAFAGQKVNREGQVYEPHRPILMNDLLSMTSGLVYPDEQTVSGTAMGAVFEDACARLEGNHPMSTQEMAERMAECPLAFSPGTSWQYGTSADVLGAVIERIVKKPLAQFMWEEIFEPLEMKDTGFFVPEEKRERLAVAYATVEQNGIPAMQRYEGNHLAILNRMDREAAFASGGAGLVSTLDDYLHFARMLQQGGIWKNRRILKEKTVAYMTHGSLSAVQQPAMGSWIGLEGYTYANFMRRCVAPELHRGICAKGEYGWDGWLGAYFANLPEQDITILMGTQKKDAGTYALTRKLRNLCLAEIL